MKQGQLRGKIMNLEQTQKNKPKLLILASDFSPPRSGVGQYVTQLSNRLRNNWDVTIAAPGASFNNSILHADRLPSTGPSTFSVARIIEWTALMSGAGAAQGRPNIIHAHGFMSAIAAQTLSEIYNVPWILTKHCWLESYDNAPAVAFEIQKWAVSNAPTLVAPSRWLAKVMTDQANLQQPPHIIYASSSVPKENFGQPSREQSGRVFVHSGAQYHKGLDRTLRAFKECANKNDTLYVVGNIESIFQNDLEKYGKDERIHFLGHLPQREAWKIYASADAMIAPSRSEGLPLAVIEAQKLGCPVLCTTDTSIGEIVIDGTTGICTNNEQELADNLKTFSPLSTSERQKIADITRERFTWTKTCRNYESVYHSLLN